MVDEEKSLVGGETGDESILCPNCGQEMKKLEFEKGKVHLCLECELWTHDKGHTYNPLSEGYVDGCPNCNGCQACEEDHGYNIPQAGGWECPVCGWSGWFVANRCNLCDRRNCPAITEEPIWAPGLALLEING